MDNRRGNAQDEIVLVTTCQKALISCTNLGNGSSISIEVPAGTDSDLRVTDDDLQATVWAINGGTVTISYTWLEGETASILEDSALIDKKSTVDGKTINNVTVVTDGDFLVYIPKFRIGAGKVLANASTPDFSGTSDIILGYALKINHGNRQHPWSAFAFRISFWRLPRAYPKIPAVAQ
ncbi:MAG: hypothetical protein LBT59_25160 [Clostridiales bacterium]|nr:hypothetical protein [Clostridiales bacterium]